MNLFNILYEKILKENSISIENQQTIQQIAIKVRKRLTNDEDENLKAMCLLVSRILKKELIENNYSAIVVQGTFMVDNPEYNYEDDELDEDTLHNPLHYWVEVNNLIVDITADQFNDELDDEKFGPITIDTYENLFRYTPIHKNWK